MRGKRSDDCSYEAPGPSHPNVHTSNIHQTTRHCKFMSLSSFPALCPSQNPQYSYLKFLRDTLLPDIDTQTDRQTSVSEVQLISNSLKSLLGQGRELLWVYCSSPIISQNTEWNNNLFINYMTSRQCYIAALEKQLWTLWPSLKWESL